MGSITREMALQQLAAEEDAFMVPGMGAQPVPPPKYVPANDNHPDWDGIVKTAAYRFSAVHETLAKSERGQYVGLTRPGDPNGCADDLVTTTFAPLEELPVAEQPASSGPYVSTATGRKFFPISPRPEDVDIHHIARSMSMTCRYNGAVRRFYSTAEHSVHIARSLVKAHGKLVALAGLLHDAPESYSGFGDVVSPMKSESPFVGEIEDSIYRKAIAPRFGLDADIPEAVHIADMRIRGNEVANMVPMAWHEEYDDPLDVILQYWSPEEAEEEFLETFKALGGDRVGEVA